MIVLECCISDLCLPACSIPPEKACHTMPIKRNTGPADLKQLEAKIISAAKQGTAGPIAIMDASDWKVIPAGVWLVINSTAHCFKLIGCFVLASACFLIVDHTLKSAQVDC